MKWLLNISLLLLCNQIVFGQGEVDYLFESLPLDSLPIRTIKTHTSLKPTIRKTAEKSGDYLQVSGLADMNYYQKTQGEYKTGLGLEVTSQLNDKWYFRLAGIQGLSNFTGLSRPKAFLLQKKDKTGYGYTDIRSRISFTPNHIFNFQAGVDHNFLGEGSRSMLVSDYGRPYPFGQIRARFWRLEYSVLYQFLSEGSNNEYESKFASSHHISFNAAKWLNFGIFESVVFQPKDTLVNRGFDVEYLNPLVFYRPQEYSVGSSDNVLIGLDFSAHLKKHTIYGQFIIDEFYLSELRARTGWWANKFGGQIGVKGRLGVNNNWFYRLEYNFARPYTFSHLNDDYNYGNQGTTIGHPYGANFMEILAELKFQKKKWLGKLFANYVLTGTNLDGFNYGTNIYESYTNRPFEYGHAIGQGSQVNGITTVLTGSYEILKHGKLNGFVENHFRYHVQSNTLNYQILVGVRSQLWNDRRNY